ncbi:uncharacterized protein LOC117581268 [Drosophila guanche]|uniref:Uncharacterized protein n=1 Tax=Drosophila guanche TaxID=7266 RepID=A0A3B0J9R9_DROGU|nr:uncharacterized protein LOC117581268 [Drosophila guanche]SPP78685.1 Hypothetical predicted protein [Drosophila guanche]
MDTEEKPHWATDSEPQLEIQTEPDSQPQSQQLTDDLLKETPSPAVPMRRPRRLAPPMPAEDVLRRSIADSLMQIVVNMANVEYRRQCCEILQVSELAHEAHDKILAALQRIDEQRPAGPK